MVIFDKLTIHSYLILFLYVYRRKDFLLNAGELLLKFCYYQFIFGISLSKF